MTERLDITHALLLENLIEMRFPSGETLDLHNDFVCERIEYEATKLLLHLQAVHANTGDRRQIIVEFLGAAINKLTLDSGFASEVLGLETLERIRYEVEGELCDVLPDGNVVFLVEFYPNLSLEIIASQVSVINGPTAQMVPSSSSM